MRYTKFSKYLFTKVNSDLKNLESLDFGKKMLFGVDSKLFAFFI